MIVECEAGHKWQGRGIADSNQNDIVQNSGINR